MKILHLVLKKKWFDLIASGVKTEEYRDVKPYWEKRLLDCTAGSGSTLVACVNTDRRGIGIELMQEYYDIAEKRVRDAQAQIKMDLA